MYYLYNLIKYIDWADFDKINDIKDVMQACYKKLFVHIGQAIPKKLLHGFKGYNKFTNFFSTELVKKIKKKNIFIVKYLEIRLTYC